jgi:hypothetical protein
MHSPGRNDTECKYRNMVSKFRALSYSARCPVQTYTIWSSGLCVVCSFFFEAANLGRVAEARPGHMSCAGSHRRVIASERAFFV